MPRISDDKIEEIRRRADIVEVIGRVVPLKRAGRAQVGLCPFHQEKTPSFHVNTDRQIFKCFGCGKGGDVVKFIMEYHSVTFPDALRMLADQFGVPLQWEMGDPGGSSGLREALFEINAFAADHFRRMLAHAERGGVAREYLHKRGVDPEVGRRFGLGWAPDEWEGLCNALRGAGRSLERAADAGVLVKKDSGGYIDRFRGRLMFPIRNEAGKVTGFSGRVLVGDDKAKYINSSESRIFVKGRQFYAMDLAADGIRRADRAILCEGNLDVIMLHQHGFTEALAALGTALTEDHVRRLTRATRNIFLIFDADEAGRRATQRALDLFLAQGSAEPRAVVLPQGDDPDSFLRREGADALAERLASAPTVVEFVVDNTFARNDSDNAGRAKAVNELLPLLASFSNAVAQGLWIKTVAERARVGEDAVRHQLRTLRRPRPEAAGESRIKTAPAEESVAEREMIRLLLHHPRLALAADTDNIIELFMDSDLKRLASELIGRCLDSQDEPELNRRVNDWIVSIEDDERQNELAGWAMDEGRVDERNADTAYRELSSRLGIVRLRRRLDALDDELAAARERGDHERQLALMAEKGQLRARLDTLAQAMSQAR